MDNTDTEKAIKYFFTLKKMNPYDEENVHLMMNFYHRRNEIEKCISLYKDLEKTLHEDLSVEPNLELKNLYRALLLEKKTPIKKNQPLFLRQKTRT